jgi:hypothetical protein
VTTGDRRRCPVCHSEVWRTSYGKIAAHPDSFGFDQCPAVGEPWRIAERWWRRARRRSVA